MRGVNPEYLCDHPDCDGETIGWFYERPHEATDAVRCPKHVDDALTTLGVLLRECKANLTLDLERSNTKPCIACGTTERPRDLIHVGTYAISPGGGILAGDDITRPVCAKCAPRFR